MAKNLEQKAREALGFVPTSGVDGISQGSKEGLRYGLKYGVLRRYGLVLRRCGLKKRYGFVL